jgi:hypothetical protein
MPIHRLRAVCSPMDSVMQAFEPGLKLCLVVLPCHAIYAGGGFALERIERLPECIDVDMVEKRGELFLLPLPCSLPYAVQRLGHTSPALCPECVLLSRVPLGSWPWLHHLRHRKTGFVRRLHRYYARIRLLPIVHRWLRLLAFPPRTIRPSGPMADQEISRFPYKKLPHMPGSATTPKRLGARDSAPLRVAFRTVDSVGSRENILSRLNGWPMRSPADASQTSSRRPAHGSRPMWIATPSS